MIVRRGGKTAAMTLLPFQPELSAASRPGTEMPSSESHLIMDSDIEGAF